MGSSVDYYFASKWPGTNESFTALPNLLIINQKTLHITNGEMAILMNLIMYKWSAKDPYPAVSSISKHTGMASNTVRMHIRRLENKGLLIRKYRKYKTTAYSLDPLVSKLHIISLKAEASSKNSIHLSQDPDRVPYQYPDTKEDEDNKTNIRRHINTGRADYFSNLLEESFGFKI